MEFDSTSKFGVRSSKSRKRTKKGYESKGKYLINLIYILTLHIQSI